MAKVLISDELSPKAIDIFKNRGIQVDFKPGLKAPDLISIIGEYDGLAIRSATKVTPEVMAAAKNLKVVGRAGIGVDNVDVPAATAKGIVVMNTPFGNSVTTAEQTIALLFAVARRIGEADASTKASKWEKSKFMGVELFGKTLGVIGCGNIGAIVIDRALGLKMQVIGYDPFLTEERAKNLGIEKVELDALLSRADFITLHTPLTDKTKYILNKETLAKTKKGVRIINCARGGLVEEAALIEALKSGQVAGAALDVFEVEPAKDNPLFSMENVVVTPHLGASTEEAQENVALQVAEQMSDYLLNGAVANSVNVPSVTAADAPKLKPYMILAEQLGSFVGQMIGSGIKSVTVDFEGHVATLNTKPLTSLLVANLLKPTLNAVNMVNALSIAKEREIAVNETRNEDSEDYQTLIRLTVQTENRKRIFAATLFGHNQPRIVEVDGITIESEISNHMLFIRNNDKPGFIGNLGKALGDAGVNIATFHLGRKGAGEEAIIIVQVDSAVQPETLAVINNLGNVLEVKALSF